MVVILVIMECSYTAKFLDDLKQEIVILVIMECSHTVLMVII